MLCYVVLCYDYCVMLCYVMGLLCCVIVLLCYVVLWRIKSVLAIKTKLDAS